MHIKFLKDLMGICEGPSSDLTEYSYNFFNKYVNQDKLSTLVKVQEKYFELIELLKYRKKLFNSVSEKELDELFKNIEIYSEKIKSRKNEQNSLCNKKRELLEARLIEYTMSEVDFSKLVELSNNDNEISKKLSDSDQQLHADYFDYKNLLVKKDDIYCDRNSNEDMINICIDELKLLCGTLEDTDIFNGLRVENLVRDFSDGLKDIVTDDNKRNAYGEYYFSSLFHQLNIAKDTYNLASKYLSLVSQADNYYVDEVFPESDKLYFEEGLDENLRNLISSYIMPSYGEGLEENQKWLEVLKKVYVFIESVGVSNSEELARMYDSLTKDALELGNVASNLTNRLMLPLEKTISIDVFNVFKENVVAPLSNLNCSILSFNDKN